MTARPLRMAIAGLGQGAGGIMPSMAAMPEIEMIAGADVDEKMRAGFEARYPGTRTYDSVAALCKDPDVEAVWVSTPNRLHCEHAIEAMRHGKHVITEKPMAISIDEADRMCAEATKNGVELIAGHTSSYGLAIRAMRRIVQSGVIGAVRSIFIWSYTDWMLLPRTPDELVTAEGGGLVHRQGPHQIDIIRLLGGGKLRSVRGMAGQWMPERGDSSPSCSQARPRASQLSADRCKRSSLSRSFDKLGTTRRVLQRKSDCACGATAVPVFQIRTCPLCHPERSEAKSRDGPLSRT